MLSTCTSTQSALCKEHEKFVCVLLSILLQKSNIKIDNFGKVAKHTVTGNSDNDGISEESANFM